MSAFRILTPRGRIDDSKIIPINPNFHSVLLDAKGDFTHGFRADTFFSCEHGTFIYSDPDYADGNNTIRRTRHSLQTWLDQVVGAYGTDLGEHIVRNFVKPNVRIL